MYQGEPTPKRRVPGSGIDPVKAKSSFFASPATKLDRPPQLAAQRPAPSTDKPKAASIPQLNHRQSVSVPPQWRHVVIFVLAISTALLGFKNQTQPTNAIASDSDTPAATNTNDIRETRPTVQLPSVKSITLPPIPTKKNSLKDPAIAATNVVLLDDDSKIALYDKGGDERIAIASTTKIATAMVVLEKYKLTDKVTISDEAISTIGSAVGFRRGETATVEQLLYGLMLVSGNDAAIQLSEIMAQPGDTDQSARFVVEMNNLAKRLSMTDTYFKHPAGLDDSAYSSAADMAKLMSYALKNPTFRQLIKTADYNYTSEQGYLHTFKNSNRLITSEMYYNGMLGGKTGFTPETPEGGAGHCLIVAAERNGHTLIAAVYKTYSSAPQASAEVARTLLDYGFNNFEWVSITR